MERAQRGRGSYNHNMEEIYAKLRFCQNVLRGDQNAMHRTQNALRSGVFSL